MAPGFAPPWDAWRFQFLDLGLVSNRWKNSISDYYVDHETGFDSDHAPVHFLLKIILQAQQEDECNEIVRFRPPYNEKYKLL